jgi:uncharacterized protein (DUF433 family)
MCARGSRAPASVARGIRLPRTLDLALRAEAERRGHTFSALATELLDEGLKQRQAPGVTFVDGAHGRRAVVAGSGIDVWEVVRTWKEAREDLAATLAAYPSLSEIQVRTALGYYARFGAEIDERLQRESAWTEERVCRELPYATPRTT